MLLGVTWGWAQMTKPFPGKVDAADLRRHGVPRGRRAVRPGRHGQRAQRQRPRGAGRPHPGAARRRTASPRARPATPPRAPRSTTPSEIWVDDADNPARQAGRAPGSARCRVVEHPETDRGRRHRGGRRPVRRAPAGPAVGRRSTDDAVVCSPPVRAERSLSARPSHWASRPRALTWRSRSSVLSRCLRGVTTSRSSPCLSTVRRSGTSVSPSRMIIETDEPRGQPELADLDAVHLRDRADRHLEQVGGDALERGRLDLEVARLGAPGHLSTLATSGSVGPVSRV